MKLLILSRHADEYRSLIDQAGLGLSIIIAADVNEARRTAADAAIVLAEPAPGVQAIRELSSIRWLQCTWAGIEPFLASDVRRDYTLTNVRGVFGPQMSEYVFAYLLAYERRIFERRAAQQERRWDHSAPGALQGKTIGLLGVGTIGAALAGTAKHFGMRVKGYTRRSEASADVDAWYHGAQLAAFAEDVDYLVSILPNTPATRHVVNADLLRALPRRAVLVNPGRGSAVDERVLVAALRDGTIAAAILDVFETEPLPDDHPFWSMPNVFVTGHTAAVSRPVDIAPLFIDNCRRFLRGEPLKHVVDFELGY